MTDAPDYQVLTAMLSPALFMTATGSLLLSANQRLARVVDRLRTLTDLGDQIVRGASTLNRPDERLHHIRGMIALQQKRGNIILMSVTLLYAAFGAFVGSSLCIAVNILTSHMLAAIPIGLAVLGVSSLLVASLGMLREARLGVRALKRDVDFYVGLTVRFGDGGADRRATGLAPVGK